MVKSTLLNLDGVGNATYEKLMKKYKTLAMIKTLSEEELISEVGKRAGKSIYDYLHSGREEK
jgi:ERCC4-type nuclease